MTKNIFNWNHISSDLTEDQIEELKSYYITYHPKCWAYKQAAISKIGNGESRNGERGTGNEERGISKIGNI